MLHRPKKVKQEEDYEDVQEALRTIESDITELERELWMLRSQDSEHVIERKKALAIQYGLDELAKRWVKRGVIV